MLANDSHFGIRSKRRRIYRLGWLLNLGLLRVVGTDSVIRIWYTHTKAMEGVI